MFHLDTLSQFSCNHCVALCSFLVPANLLATLQTLALTGLRRPLMQIQLAVGLASLLASALLLHVFAWFAIGVVMAPTYVLLGLAGLCLGINVWAIVNPAGMGWLLTTGYRSLVRGQIRSNA